MSSARADVSRGPPAYDHKSRSNDAAVTLGSSTKQAERDLDLRKLKLNEQSHEEMDQRSSQASLMQQRPPLVNVDLHQPSDDVSDHAPMTAQLPTINPG